MNTENKTQGVKTDIELKIIMGKYQAGERVPSIRKMAELYPIGVAMARIVLEKMYQEGTLTLEQGIGYSVSYDAREELLKKYKKRYYDMLSEICEDTIKIGINPIELMQEIMNKR